MDSQIQEIIKSEEKRQQEVITLIASENYASKEVREVTGSVLTNKYAEGYPHKRYYGGTEIVDQAEDLAIERAKQLFGAEHVNVQPYSGTNPNLAVYLTALQPGDTALAMDLNSGGHLSHGSPLSLSGKIYKFVHYGVNTETELIDFDQIKKLAGKHQPKLIVAGASAYSRIIDFKKFREIADSVGALLLVDMAHISGLVAAGVHPSPVPFADFVTTSTHKTLRGPRGGMILCKEKYAPSLDRNLFPGLQGGPLMNVIAAKAVCFAEALKPEFKIYTQQVIKNAKAMEVQFQKDNIRMLTGGTDNHLLNIHLGFDGPTGKEIELALGEVGLVVNREALPGDTRPPYIASGIRVGTPAVTTRGMKEEQMTQIAGWIAQIIKNPADPREKEKIAAAVLNLTKQFPVQG